VASLNGSCVSWRAVVDCDCASTWVSYGHRGGVDGQPGGAEGSENVIVGRGQVRALVTDWAVGRHAGAGGGVIISDGDGANWVRGVSDDCLSRNEGDHGQSQSCEGGSHCVLRFLLVI